MDRKFQFPSRLSIFGLSAAKPLAFAQNDSHAFPAPLQKVSSFDCLPDIAGHRQLRHEPGEQLVARKLVVGQICNCQRVGEQTGEDISIRSANMNRRILEPLTE